jgi:WD40 repeat protein
MPIDSSNKDSRRLCFVRLSRRLICLLSVSLLVSLAVGCGQSPEQTIAWPNRRYKGDVGASGDYIFYPTNKNQSALDVWQWADETIKETATLHVDKKIVSAAVLSPDACVVSLYAPDHESEFRVCNLKPGKTIHAWKPPEDWHTSLGRASRNGKHLAAWCEPDGSSSEPRERLRLGLLAPDGESFDWVATVNKTFGRGGMGFRVVPSEDGQFLALATLAKGILMVNAAQRKVAWATIAPDERAFLDPSSAAPDISWREVPFENWGAYDVAFTPDSKVMYAGCDYGLLFGINVETGAVVSRWWANLSGKEESGQYVFRVAVSPDGRFVAAGTVPEPLVFVFSTRDGHRYTFNHGGDFGINLLSFSPDSKRLASQSGGELKIWKLPEEAE